MPRCSKNISYISFISSISLLRTWWTQRSRLMTKQTKWLCAQQRLRSAWASAQSDHSLRCALNGYLSSRGQWRLWSNWADAQADLSIRWAQSSFCWFSHEAAQINASIRSSYLPDIIWKQPFFLQIFLSNTLVPFKNIVLSEYLKCRPQLTAHARGIKN